MNHILAEFDLLDTVGAARVTVRACSAGGVGDRDITGIGDLPWAPAITRKPKLSQFFFDGDFSTGVGRATATLDININPLRVQSPIIPRLLWQGAPVRLYVGPSLQSWPWAPAFIGRVTRFKAEGPVITVTADVDIEPFRADALTVKYAGTGGREGGPDLANKVKPWLLGHCRSVQPVLINNVDNVYQFSAYGPIAGIDALYERGSVFGPPSNDYPDYDALVAAVIAPGEWATCIAEGMIRMGAPAFGVLTADVRGHYTHTTLWERTGDICMRLLENAGVTESQMDRKSFADLDASMQGWPNQGRIGVYLENQEQVGDVVERLIAPCNAISSMDWLGRIFVKRPSVGDRDDVTFDAQGRQLPPVTLCSEEPVSPPFKRIEFGSELCWRVHSFDEIASYYEFVERGDYSPQNDYREGNIVDMPDGSRWLYINLTPTRGSLIANAPPNEAYWEQLTDKNYVGVTVDEAVTIADTVDNPVNADRFARGRITLFVQDTAPVGMLGDIWFTVAGAQMEYDGVSWVPPADPAFGLALRAAAGDYVVISGRSDLIISGVEPTDNSISNLWYNQGTRQIRHYNGTAGWTRLIVNGSRLDFNIEDSTGNNVVDADVFELDIRNGPASYEFLYNFDGTAKQGQFPKTFNFRMFRGNNVDVTDQAVWTYTLLSGGATYSPDDGGVRGRLTINSVSSTAVIRLIATLDGVPRQWDVNLVRSDDASPTQGSGGASSASDSTIASTNVDVYPADTADGPAGPVMVNSGASGSVKVTLPLSYFRAGLAIGNTKATALVRYRESGTGTWTQEPLSEVTDAGGAFTVDFSEILEGIEPLPGALNISYTFTTLTVSTDYDFDVVIKGDNTVELIHSGTLTAIPQ